MDSIAAIPAHERPWRLTPMGGRDAVFLSGRASRTLVVAFSCWHENQDKFTDTTAFDFINAIIRSGNDGLLFRDRANLWYQKGVDGARGSPLEIVALINRLRGDYETVITVGSSMGGYAALLFGHLVNADKIVSVVPQLRVGAVAAGTIGDERALNQWKDDFEAIDRHAADRSYLYLDKLPMAKDRAIYEVYFGDSDPDDVKHIALAQLTFINPRIVTGSNHNDTARRVLRGVDLNISP